MKNIFTTLALVLTFVSAQAIASDKKPFAGEAKNNNPKTQILTSSLDAIQEEFLAEIQAYVHKTFEVPARSVNNLNKPQHEVRVYDLSGNLVYCCNANEQADLPAGSELLTVHGNIAYYMLVK
ncbi:hypothetical protein [Rhodoflexus sp.]